MKKLSVIIPVYNEENTIDETVSRVIGQTVPGWQTKIIIVDDGSTDRTRQKLKKWEGKCTIIYKPSNTGKGSAVTAAFGAADGEVILIQDADLEYSPSDYPVLLAPFENKNVSVVYGSRFLGPHLSTMFVYAQGNKFVTLMTNLLYNTNITDMETGYKLFRHDVIEGLNIRAKKFDFEPEFTVKVLKKGYQIFEVPISYFGRKFSEGKKLTWKDGVIALWTLIRYRITD
jgi:glycosyltransferase involved in cell wall biosynthesis